MFELVTGGSGSGKSEYAENLAMKMGNNEKKLFYVATMKPYDQECKKRIERHQDMRKDKGFCTIECYDDIQKIKIVQGATVLLECMSNLLANKMYAPNVSSKEALETHILEDVAYLLEHSKNLVIVTNEVFSDGIDYEEDTIEYIRCLGKINSRMAQKADHVTEIVCRIPIKIK